MISQKHNLEIAADKRADKRSLFFIYLFIIFSWVILSNADQMENERDGQVLTWLDPWLTQLTSHIGIMIVVLIVPLLVSRFPLTLENWIRKMPIYIAGFLAFGIIHITLMYLFRTLSYPRLLGRSFDQQLLDINLWLYELPKDAYTYLLVLSIIIGGRHMEQLRLEAKTAREDAKVTGRLTLKSGGRRLFIQAEEIIRVEAASNYLELETISGKHLVRMTLSDLESLIAETGDTHLRIHRSHLVKREAIRELIPNGNGGAKLKLTNNMVLPVGRHYRERLTNL